MCGLAELEWEERQSRAEQILASPEWKQKLCNDLVGLSFRELERTLRGIASERQKKEDSYERKLATYSGRSDSESKPKRNGSRVRGAGSNSKSSDVQRLPLRSIEQILAQVYAPRESEKVSTWREEGILAQFQKPSTEEDQDLFPRSDYEDGEGD